MTSRHLGFSSLAVLLPPLLAALAAPAIAQDVGRVSPASLPLPLPTAAPLPPDQLRAHNPWNLPMTGIWRFKLTHGEINKAKQFVPSTGETSGITALNYQAENPPINAFDGSVDTRWCATGNAFPQWIQADLGKTRRVSGISLVWEEPGDTYECRIEGRSTINGKWITLADKSAAPGVGGGPLTVTPADVRYVRVTVLGNSSSTHWASLREVQIKVTQNGQQVAWHPPVPKNLTLSAAKRDAFAAPSFNDSGWDKQPVPSNWEMAGYSLPTYDSVDNTVGLYRRYVVVPAAWAGKRVVWHFDGALDGAEIFINGQKAGYHESGYTAFDVDLTGLVKPGQRNLFAVRVSKTTPSDDCETGDFQAMGGIYRDTSLIAVPQTHIDDIVVRTPLAANYKDATLLTQLTVKGTPGQAVSITGSLVKANGQQAGVHVFGAGRIGANGTTLVAMSSPVKAPALWSAEKPNLYYVVFQMTSNKKPIERVEERFGFKQIEIKNNIVLWNGMPIKCTGVCRHDFWADKGFALTEANWVKDLTMMKAANINAIRTSHYNHAQRFLELCDEKGMYILDEVPYCWINDKVKDPAFAPYLLQRGLETVARDKNRPCVLAWSLGNENPNGIDSQQVTDLVRTMDPTRPRFVSGQTPNDIKGQSWEDNHYPGPESVDRFAANTKWGTNLSEHPHTFYEKEVQDYDPGMSDLWSEALIKTWDKLWKAPNILGSFIWEWQSQGIADKNPDKTTDFYYGLDHLRQENNKGIVSAYRVPKPEWWIVKSVYSPVVISVRTVSPSDGNVSVPITNHYSFTDLKELTCRWTALDGNSTLQSGVLPVACAPMQSTVASFPAPAGMKVLRLEFDHPNGSSVIAYNLAVAGVPLPAAPSALASGGALTTQDSPDTLTVRNSVQQITFDKHSGTIQSWQVNGQSRLLGGPTLNLGEAKKANGDNDIYHADQPPVTTNAAVTATPGADGTLHVAVTSTVLSGAGGSTLGTLATAYDITPDAEMTVNWTLNWTAPSINLWEEGMKFAVPVALTRMTWQRDSFFTDYPAGHLGEPSGTTQAGSVLFRSSKRSLHWLTLSGNTGAGLALLPTDAPLIGRGGTTADGTILFASREAAGDYGLSRQWVADHAIHAVQGKALSGSFMLRAFDARGLTASARK
jgi:beta-galactosidase